MPLDPQARRFLDRLAAARLPGLERLPVPLARAAFAATMLPHAEPPPKVARVHDRTLPGNVPVRVYTPGGPGPWPLLVYFHGGGWVLGSVDTIDTPCRQLALEAGCVVVSVGYRLAPEHKLPIPAEDCYLATRYVADHPAEFGGGVGARVAVGGDSAGGNLAAVVALMARDRGGPGLAFQLLVYPVADHALDTPSHRDFARGFFLTRAEMLWFWKQYLSRPEQGAHPYASPLRAADLRGLPPAWVLTAEFDPLRDEGEAYAARLRAAGVAANAVRYDGMIHGFFQMGGTIDRGRQAVRDAARALAAAWQV